MSTDDGSFGLAVLEYQKFEMWERKVSCHGGATWFLQKIVEMHTVLGITQAEGLITAMKLLA